MSRNRRLVIGLLVAAALGGAVLGEARVTSSPGAKETPPALAAAPAPSSAPTPTSTPTPTFTPTSDESPARAPSAAPAAAPAPAAATVEGDEFDEIRRLRAEPAPEADDLFKPHSWKPKPPPVIPAPPPKPVAPRLPFTYVGRMQEGGADAVFLTRGDVPIIARANAVLEGVYRVDAISEQRIAFTYLPLNQKQELLIGPPK